MKKQLLFIIAITSIVSNSIAQTKVLFLGNSFTKYTYSVPATFLGMCSAAGITVTMDYRTQGGMAVATEQNIPGHWVDATSQNKIKAQNWDFIVVQDNQGNYVNSIPSWAMGANTTLFGQIKANDTCTRIVYFAGWGPFGGSISAATSTINKIHNNMIVLNNAVADEIVSPIGKAWITSMTQMPLVNLYSSDNVHPSMEGVYLTAATIFTTIFKKDLTNVNYTGSIDATTAQNMRTIAYNTVTNSAIYPASHLNAFTPTISVNGATLTCNGTYSSYKWYYNGTLVGTNSSTYVATSNGIHKVVATNSLGCEMSSFELNVTTVGISSKEEQSKGIAINTLSNNVFELIAHESGTVLVYDTQGKLIYSETKNASTITIDLSTKSKGLYIISLISDHNRTFQKVNVQ